MNGVNLPGEHHNGAWRFLPEGALFHFNERVAVVADLHLGYEHTRASRGDFLPLDSGESLRKSLVDLFRRCGCGTLVVAGDILESSAVLRQNPAFLRQFSAWIRSQHVEPVFLRGNHDSPTLPAYASSYEIDGWCISHGHDEPVEKTPGIRRITGHLHPAMRWGGRSWRAFLSASDRILLPAFSVDAAGSDVLDFRQFPDESWGHADCLVCRSGDVVSFGNLRALRSNVAAIPRRMPRQARTSPGRRLRRH